MVVARGRGARAVFGGVPPDCDATLTSTHQVKGDYLTGRLVCSEPETLKAAAWLMHVLHGTHDPARHKPGFVDDLSTILPYADTRVQGIERKILDVHQTQSGVTDVKAKANFVHACLRCQLWGFVPFHVKDKNEATSQLVDRILCISPDHVVVVDKVSKAHVSTYEMQAVRRWAAPGGSLTIDFGTAGYRSVQTDEGPAVSKLVAGLIALAALLRKQQAAAAKALKAGKAAPSSSSSKKAAAKAPGQKLRWASKAASNNDALSSEVAALTVSNVPRSQSDSAERARARPMTPVKAPADKRRWASPSKASSTGGKRAAGNNAAARLIVGHAREDASPAAPGSPSQAARVGTNRREKKEPKTTAEALAQGVEVAKASAQRLATVQDLPAGLGSDQAWRERAALACRVGIGQHTAAIAGWVAALYTALGKHSVDASADSNVEYKTAVASINTNLANMAHHPGLLASLAATPAAAQNLLAAAREFCGLLMKLYQVLLAGVGGQQPAKQTEGQALVCVERIGASVGKIVEYGQLSNATTPRLQSAMVQVASSLTTSIKGLAEPIRAIAGKTTDGFLQASLVADTKVCVVLATRLAACAKLAAPVVSTKLGVVCITHVQLLARQLPAHLGELLADVVGADNVAATVLAQLKSEVQLITDTVRRLEQSAMTASQTAVPVTNLITERGPFA